MELVYLRLLFAQTWKGSSSADEWCLSSNTTGGEDMQAAINITTFLRNWEIVQDPCGWGPGQNLTTGNDKEPIVQYMSLNLFKNAEHAFTQYTSTEFK